MTAKKKPADKVKVGRKTRYLLRFNEEVFMLCLLGAIDEQIAEFFHVSSTTIDNWKHKHPKFLAALKRGKMHADAMVARALFSRAIGYSHLDTKMFCFEGDIISQEYMKHYPPDTTACIYWLKNRMRQIWKDKHDIGIGPSEELISLLDIIDGSSKGRLPEPHEADAVEE